MVGREGLFHRCRITEVIEELPGVCFRVAFVADAARWFDPASPSAGPDGWVRDIENVGAEFRIMGTNHSSLLDRARRWRDKRVELEGFASVERQAVGLYVPGRVPLGPEDVLVISMPAEDMDRA